MFRVDFDPILGLITDHGAFGSQRPHPRPIGYGATTRNAPRKNIPPIDGAIMVAHVIEGSL